MSISEGPMLAPVWSRRGLVGLVVLSLIGGTISAVADLTAFLCYLLGFVAGSIWMAVDTRRRAERGTS